MAHLSRKPKQVCSPADMAGGECMPGLIWVSGKRKLTAVCSHQTRIGNLDAHLI